MKDVVQPGWTWGFRCLGFDFLFVKPLCVSHSQQVFPLIHEVEMLLFLTEKKKYRLAAFVLAAALGVCLGGERTEFLLCVHINNTEYKYGQQWHQWSGFVSPASLEGAWQTFKGYCCQKIMKQKNYKSKLPWSPSSSARAESHCVRNQITSPFSRASESRAARAALGGSRMLWNNIIPWDLPTLNRVPCFSVWIGISDYDKVIDVTVQHCLASANRSKQWMETSEQEEVGVQNGAFAGSLQKVKWSWVCASSNLAGLYNF